jgi:hypothetical protein
MTRPLSLALAAVLLVTATAAPSRAGAPAAALPETRVTILASGKGLPWVSLADGVAAGDASAAKRSFEGRALASADVDGDGVRDLICLYAGAAEASIVVYRGNLAALYPNAPEARGASTDAPLLFDRELAPVPVAAELLAAGDFDNDGRVDLAAAAPGDRALYVMAGEPGGAFGPPRAVEMPGAVTALASGDVNRPDGLGDLVVGVADGGSARLLVFEGPDGALEAEPETFELDYPATAIAIGAVTSHGATDVVAAAGRELVLVGGRDRRITLDADARGDVAPATVSRRELETPIRSLALDAGLGELARGIALVTANGELRVLRRADGDGATDPLAAFVESPSETRPCSATSSPLFAGVAARPARELVLADAGEGRLDLYPAASGGIDASLAVESGPAAALPMRLNEDALDDLVVLPRSGDAPSVLRTSPVSTFVVTTADESGPGSLADVIAAANASAGADRVTFSLPPGGVRSIVLSERLPGFNEPVTIDATTQPGFAGVPLVEVTGNDTTYGGPSGLRFFGGRSAVRGLSITNTNYYSLVEFSDNGSNILEGNWIGVAPEGGHDGSDTSGILVNNVPGTVVGGTAAPARNIIAPSSGSGVWITGMRAAGTIVQGNYFDLDATGEGLVGGGFIHVAIDEAPNTRVGGTEPGARNCFAYTGTGVAARGANATGTIVQGNLFGSNAAGTRRLTLSSGVEIREGAAATIGGTATRAGNVISGARSWGVVAVGSDTVDTLVQGNFIGTDITGTTAIPNDDNGVITGTASRTVVGGATPSARNVISGNGDDHFGGRGSGIAVYGGLGDSPGLVLVQGNYVGTDATGTRAIPNQAEGIVFSDVSNVSLLDNVVSGNRGAGVRICAGCVSTLTPLSAKNRIARNLVGAGADGRTPVGNGGAGLVLEGATNTRIGGGPSEANTFAHNGGAGVRVVAGAGNSVLGNSIFANAGPGIDLDAEGPSPNDAGDGDAGANDLQNFPTVQSAASDGSTTAVRATLSARPGSAFTVEFYGTNACGAPGNSQGRRFLGSTRVTTDGGGTAAISATLPAPVYADEAVTATATDAAGSTSEFGPCAAATGPPAADLAVSLSAPDPAGQGRPFDAVVSLLDDGPTDATGVTLTCVVADGASVEAASSTAGNVTRTGNTVTCVVDRVANGETVTLTVTVVAPQIGGLAISASATGALPDLDGSNNTATRTPDVRAVPAVTKAKFNAGRSQLRVCSPVFASAIPLDDVQIEINGTIAAPFSPPRVDTATQCLKLFGDRYRFNINPGRNNVLVLIVRGVRSDPKQFKG